jgi:hypothetical protein
MSELPAPADARGALVRAENTRAAGLQASRKIEWILFSSLILCLPSLAIIPAPPILRASIQI